MKNKQLFSERRELKRIAGLLKEDDYSMGTPSGDTDAMNIGEADYVSKFASSGYGPSMVRDFGSAADVVADVLDYLEGQADFENKAGSLMRDLEDLYKFLSKKHDGQG